MGKICEIFGPITTPFYVVKWASSVPAITVKNARGTGNNANNSSKKKNKKRGSGASKSVNENVDKSIENENLDENENSNCEEGHAGNVEEDTEHVEDGVDAEMSGTHSMTGDVCPDRMVMVVEGEREAAVGESEAVPDEVITDATQCMSSSTSSTTNDASAIPENVRSTPSQPIQSERAASAAITSTSSSASSARADYFQLLLSRALPGTQGAYVRIY